MLDFMRRQRSKLKWVLVLVIVVLGGGMVISFIPGVGDGNRLSASRSSDVARVGNETVSATEFETSYRNYLRSMQQRQELSPEILKAFGFDRQVLNALVEQKIKLAEAKRLGFDVTEEELANRIMTNPSFQAGGSFIGRDRYQALLQANDLTMERFESVVRDELLVGKVQSFVTAGVTVSDKEVEDEYRNRNEKAQITYFVIDPAKLETKIAALTDQELRTYYDKNSAKYNVPEKRKSRYAFVDMVKFKTEMKADATADTKAAKAQAKADKKKAKAEAKAAKKAAAAEKKAEKSAADAKATDKKANAEATKDKAVAKANATEKKAEVKADAKKEEAKK